MPLDTILLKVGITLICSYHTEFTLTSVQSEHFSLRSLPSLIITYYGHGKRQKKSERESSFPFVLLLTTLRTVSDTQCVRRCSNAYFYALFIFPVRF